MNEMWNTIHQIFEGMKIQQNVELTEIAQLIQAVESLAAEEPGEWHSFAHVTEKYYYEYFCQGTECKEAPVNVAEIWRYFGMQLKKAGQTEDALAAFERSLQWNPVDVESLLALGECCKDLGDLERLWEVNDELYDLCNTRALMARYYRNLGFYYVETYQPELAEVLYLYSELYCPTQTAQGELAFIREALERKTPLYTEEQMREILEESEIPQDPSEEMTALTWRAGEDCEEAGRFEEARECWLLLYDLTGSPKVLERLEELSI